VTARRPRAVVVGIDHSPQSLAAADLAAWEATRRGIALHLVEGIQLRPAAGGSRSGAGILDVAQRRLDAVAQRLRDDHPGLPVVARLAEGTGADVLVAASAAAELVVVGTHGDGVLSRALLGSVSRAVVRRAYAPVLIQPRTAAAQVPPPGPVVVGVDGSPGGAAALAVAFDEAAARGVALLAVHVWAVPQADDLVAEPRWPTDREEVAALLHAGAQRRLAEALAGWQERYPDVPVHRKAPHGFGPARVLAGLADDCDAGLLVVGATGRRPVEGVLVASVPAALAREATRPLLVARPSVPATVTARR
jgi:nucleotide-binding universal stress UspA family protein